MKIYGAIIRHDVIIVQKIMKYKMKGLLCVSYHSVREMARKG